MFKYRITAKVYSGAFNYKITAESETYTAEDEEEMYEYSNLQIQWLKNQNPGWVTFTRTVYEFSCTGIKPILRKKHETTEYNF